MYEINFLPVLTASVVSFIISSIWYSTMLFGRTWMGLVNIDEETVAEDRARGIWKKYTIHFIATLIMFFVLSFFISLTGPMSAIDGAFLGLIMWGGFIATSSVGDLLWRRTSAKLVLIDNANILIGLIIGGAIIAAF